VKWALGRMGWAGSTLRLPMTTMAQSNVPTVQAALKSVGLI
jgi:4-hydroxy-tetrahydrodipicolinate synthase